MNSNSTLRFWLIVLNSLKANLKLVFKSTKEIFLLQYYQGYMFPFVRIMLFSVEITENNQVPCFYDEGDYKAYLAGCK